MLEEDAIDIFRGVEVRRKQGKVRLALSSLLRILPERACLTGVYRWK